MKRDTRSRARRGATIIEFALVTLLLMIVILASVEFDRMLLVYTAVANSAKAGARYAIVHGADRTGSSGSDPQSGPGNNPAGVLDTIRRYASAGVLDVGLLTDGGCASASSTGICVTYPNGTNTTGSPVAVRVVYPYDPFVALPIRVNLTATAEGIIVF
jgi:Flp pilus assembly protein TadG